MESEAEIKTNELRVRKTKKASTKTKEIAKETEEKVESEPCSICCRHYTKYMRCQIKCPYCEQITCKECCKHYFLNKSTPHCIHCKKIMNEDFLYENFPKTWVNTELIQHQSNIIFEQQKAMLPETSKEIYKEELQEQIQSQRSKVDTLEYRLRSHQAHMNTRVNVVSDHAKQTHTRLSQEYETEMKKLIELSEQCGSEMIIKSNQPCLLANCKGFCRFDHTREELVCMVCKNIFCSLCYVGKKSNHKCDPEQVKTIAMVRKDTKHCPSCKELIYKVSGCDQMFCTACNTCFSWETGEIDKGRVHNPHYFEYQRKLKEQGKELQEKVQNNNNNNNNNQVNLECLDFRNYNSITSVLFSKSQLMTQAQMEYVAKLVQFLNHILGVEMPPLNNLTEDAYRYERRSYLRNRLTEESFKNTILSTELRRRKMTARYFIFDMLCTVLGDIITSFLSKNEKMTDDFSQQVQSLVIYFNKQQAKLAQTFSEAKIIYIDPEEPFSIKRKRNTRDLNLDVQPMDVHGICDWMNETEKHLFTIYEQEKVWLESNAWDKFFLDRDEDISFVAKGYSLILEEEQKRNRTLFCERAFQLIHQQRNKHIKPLIRCIQMDDKHESLFFELKDDPKKHSILLWYYQHPCFVPYIDSNRIDKKFQDEDIAELELDNLLTNEIKKFILPVSADYKTQAYILHHLSIL
jgi:hypothetical protein